jgi:hypothetical protein
MRSLRAGFIAVVFATSMAAAAWAQQTSGPSPGGSLPGPNATPPGAEGNSTSGNNQVQPVPGAMPGSEAVPSTISGKNAADDKLNILAYTFKGLTAEQRRAVYQVLNGKGPRVAQADIPVGLELRSPVELPAVPDTVAAQVPQMKGYEFAQAGDKVVLVDPETRAVVGELTP